MFVEPWPLSSWRKIAIEAQAQPRGEFLARAPQAGLECISRDAQNLRSLFRGKPFNLPQPESCPQERRNFREFLADTIAQLGSGIQLLRIGAFVREAFRQRQLPFGGDFVEGNRWTRALAAPAHKRRVDDDSSEPG